LVACEAGYQVFKQFLSLSIGTSLSAVRLFLISPLASSLIRPSVCTDPPSTNAVVVAKTNDGSSYMDLTSASIDDKRYLYAANFTLGRGDAVLASVGVKGAGRRFSLHYSLP